MTTALRPNTGSSERTDVFIPSPRQRHADQRPQQPTAQSSIPREPRFPGDEWSRAIFTQSLDGILLLSEAGLIFAANPAACWMLQRPEEEMCGLSLNAVVETSHVDSAEVAWAWPGHFRGELTMLRADGNPFPADVSATRFTDDSGQERTVVFFHNVSDRHQVEKAFQESHVTARQQAEEALRHANSELEARVAERTRDLAQANADLRIEIAARQRAEDTLRTSEERYRIIGQSLSDCAFSFKITEEGHNIFDWVTDNFTKITGIPPEEIFGSPNPLKNTMHPEDRTRNIRILMALEPDTPVTCEFRLMHPERGLRWIRAYIQRVGTEPDQAIRFHGAAQDITDRKQEQEEIDRLNRLLSQQVSELSDLTQELEAFSYSVSHDLRAPLRHIHGFVELLHQHTAATLDVKGRRYIEVITKSAKQMGQLIDDLLAFSRTTRTELRPTRVNLTHIVNEVVLDFAAETDARKIVWDISPLPDVYGDTALLRVVLTNLLENAVKYTRPRGAARITIGTTTTAHDQVCFVRDNGVGFDMQYVEKLFGVFQRLHRADEFEGTGIGLATVRRIVQRLGGRIWAEGELDKGATFYFSLPLAQKGTEG